MTVLPCAAGAQVPDVAPFLELRPTWQVRATKKSLFEYYDAVGRYSLVGLRMVLESGHRVYVAQRFQRVDNTGDPDTLDEYYVEQRGSWRLGKQYLPFGRREILRTTVAAARFDTNLLLDDAPLSLAACDGGSGRTRAVYGRIGGEIGLSFAIGNHIGIQPTDLARFRDVEAAPGIGRGYRLALGADTQVRVGSALVSVEWASLRRGETPLDSDQDLSDVRLKLPPNDRGDKLSLGWSRDWSSQTSVTSLEIELFGNGKISYLPSVRFDGFGFRDFSISAVMKF